jgi:4-hydroxy-tetrahydrodipicolinate synthase
VEHGIFGPLIVDLVTPFRDGRVDHSALRILVSRQIDAGVSSVVVCSAAGEAPCLNRDERCQTIRSVVEAAGERVPIIAGVCANSTQEAIGMCQEAALAGAAALLVTVPFYNKPGERGIHAHFAAIATQVRMPIFIDNLPSRTGADLSEALAANMLALDNVVGLVEEN